LKDKIALYVSVHLRIESELEKLSHFAK